MPYPIHAYPFNEYERKLVFIKAYIADVCNYDCSYCYNKKPRSKKMLDLNKLLNFIEKAHEQTHRNIFLELIGGEPTLHPGLVEFCRIAQKQNYINTVYVYSNLTKNIDTYLSLLDNSKIQLHLSWHSTKDDPLNKSFYVKAKQLCHFKHVLDRITFNIMYENNLIKQVVLIYDLLKKLGAIVDLAQVGQLDKINSVGRYDYYSKDDYEKFKSIINSQKSYPEVQILFSDKSICNVTLNNLMDMIDKKKISFHGWLCNAGIDRYYVHCDEMVYRCQQEYENGLKPVFQITDAIDFNECKPHICQCDACLCEGFIEKRAIA